MSRCFPFPPPGFEKKVRPEDENLLEKEKRKEKKHKKEKKEKEKKDKKEKKDGEGKQKKDKERSKEKHKEKKDRKGKHKEKNDKRKEKEKKRPSNESNTVGPPESSNGYNPVSSCTQSDEASEFKSLVGLYSGIRDGDKATKSHMVPKINLTTCKQGAELARKVVDNNTVHMIEGNVKRDDKRYIDRKVVDARVNQNGLLPYFDVANQRKVERVAGLEEKRVEKRMVQKENEEHMSCDSGRDGNKDIDWDTKSKSNQKREKEMESNKEQLKTRESLMNTVWYNSNTKSSILLKESDKNLNLGKRKERGMSEYLHENETQPYKLQRPPSSSDKVVENGRKMTPQQTLIQSVPELVVMIDNHKLNSNNAPLSYAASENGYKLEAIPYDTQFAPQWRGTGNNQKVDNNVSSFHPDLKNGRMPGTAASMLASEFQGTSNGHKVESKVLFSPPSLENKKVEVHMASSNIPARGHEWIGELKVEDYKECKNNGLIEDKKLNVCSMSPSSSTIKKKVESPKPPHPDSKYLNQILTIPSVEWPYLDEQEWLLGSNSLQTNRATFSSSQVEGTKEVWAEARQVESADITILPYDRLVMVLMEMHILQGRFALRYYSWTSYGVSRIG